MSNTRRIANKWGGIALLFLFAVAVESARAADGPIPVSTPTVVLSTPSVAVSTPAKTATPTAVVLSTPSVVTSTPAVSASTKTTPSAAVPVLSSTAAAQTATPREKSEDERLKEILEEISKRRGKFHVDSSTEVAIIEKVTVDDTGNRLLVLIQASKPIECFVFERRDPPSLFVQFMSTGVYASGEPVQVVGIDPLTEIRYGYANFQDIASSGGDTSRQIPIEYLQFRLTRPVFYHVQQEGWVFVLGLDRTTTRVEIPELDFRFEPAQYQGAANLPQNPRLNNFVEVAQANSRLLAVARDEVDLAKFRVVEARRTMLPALTGRISATRGKEVNPFPRDAFEGFEATTFKRDEYGVQVTQPVWQSGRLYGAYRQSKLNRLMAFENLRKQAQDLTFEVKKAYYTLLKNQSILRIRRELVAQGEILKGLVKEKHKLELTSQAEVLNVTAQADQASYHLTSDEQNVALARLVLISLLNQGDPVPDPVPGALAFSRMSFNVESIITWAQAHRPDVRIAMLNTELARYNWKAARADGKIKLDASGFYGRAGAAFADDELIKHEAWNVGLKVKREFWGNTLRGNYGKEKTAPDLGQSFVTESQQKSLELGLLDAMPGVSNKRQAELQYEKAKAELVEATRKAEFQVRETYYNLEKAARQLEAVREDLTYRQKDLDITREKVKLGLAEMSQLMTAEASYAQAQITEQEALSAYSTALAEMDRVAGAEVVRE